ncbi:MAG: hypothetical protein ACR2HJ_05850 [Fimbriimonadales bacterium]
MKSLLQISSGATSITKMGARLPVLLSGFSIAACALGQGMLERVWIDPEPKEAAARLISSDGRYCLFAGIGRLWGNSEIRDLTTGALVSSIPYDWTHDISFSGDGRYVSQYDAVYRVEDGQFVWRAPSGGSFGHLNLKLTTTGEFVYGQIVAKETNSLVKLRVGSSDSTLMFSNGGMQLFGPNLSADGSRGAIRAAGDGRLHVWNTDDDVISSFPLDVPVNHYVSFAGPDKVAGEFVYYETQTVDIHIFNSHNGQFIGTLGHHETGTFQSDATGDFAIWGSNRGIYIYDVSEMTLLGTYNEPFGWFSDISDDGRYIASMSVVGTTPYEGVYRNPHTGIIGTPNAFSIFRGGLISGNVASLVNDDDSRLTVRPGPVFVNSQSPIHVIVDSTVPVGPVSSLRMLLDGRAASTNIEQRIEFYDFVAGAYQTVDLRQATTSDSLAVVNAGLNPGRFVQALTGKVRSRIRYKATGAIFQYPWTIGIDYMSWRLDR